MNIDVLATGSKANCYAFCDAEHTILIECGLRYQKTLSLLKWKLPDAILITHEHSDHARAARQFIERGVEMFMTQGTADALRLNRHNLHIIKPNETFEVCGHKVLPFRVKHDAREPVNFIFDDVLFITDAGEIPDNILSLVTCRLSLVLIEANYDFATLLRADIDEPQKQRIRENHLSIRQTLNFLKTIDEPERLYLIHKSARHADAANFVQRVKSATGFKNVYCM